MAEEMERTLRRRMSGAADVTARRASEAAPASADLPPAFTALLDGSRVQLTVLQALASGGEGSLYLAKADKTLHVVKVLTYEADAEVIDALYRNSSAIRDVSLMPIEYVGSMGDLQGQHFDTRQYLVLPYYPAGDLSRPENLRRINPSIAFDGDTFTGSNADYAHITCDYGALDQTAFSELLRQLHEAVKRLHTSEFLEGSGGIVHRDIRPQNIMIGGAGEYVLGDYGLVSVLGRGLEMKLTRRFGLSHGYSPPEAYAGGHIRQSVSRKYDYFSLGMTLLHAAGGRPRYLLHDGSGPMAPYETLLDDFYETIALSNVQLPDDLPPRVQNLLRGLLLAPPEYRWGAQEVDEWLAGADPALHSGVLEQDSGISMKFDRRVHRGEREIVEVILSNWEDFRELTGQGSLEFQWTDPDLAVKRRVDAALARSRFMNPELGLREVVRAVDPSAGHLFFGRRFASDQELGHAMADTAHPDAALFARYLADGGLSAIKRASSSDDAQLETVEMLEAYARVRPPEAVRLTGILLCGMPLPPLEIPLSSGETLRLSLPELVDILQAEFAAMLQMHTVRTAPLPSITPVPGCYGEGSAPCIVQYDGSLIVPGVPGANMEIPQRLADLLHWISGGRLTGSVAMLEPLLFLHMYEAGWIRSDARARDNMTKETGQALLGPSLPDMLELLGIFPRFRTEHGLDDCMLTYFARIRRLMDRTAGILIPRCTAKAVRINAHRLAAKDAVRTFEETRSWEDLLRAAAAAQQALEEIRKLAPANYAAALETARAFEEVFSMPNGALREEFDRTAAAFADGLDSPEHLLGLAAAMKELQERALQMQKQNLRRYALSSEIEFLRTLSRTSGNRIPFPLPDTMEADEYFHQLQSWVRNYKGSGGGHG